MIYKTYNKTLNNLTEKVKKIFKYNIIGKIEFTNYTDDIKQAKIIYKYYIYKNDKLIKILNDTDITEKELDALCKKYNTKLNINLDNLTDNELNYLLELLEDN